MADDDSSSDDRTSMLFQGRDDDSSDITSMDSGIFPSLLLPAENMFFPPVDAAASFALGEMDTMVECGVCGLASVLTITGRTR